MNNKKLGTITYNISEANPFVYGSKGYVVETGQTLGKFFKSKKTAENWCKTKAEKFKLIYSIKYN